MVRVNELQLSKDLNVITAEIQSYKQIAGHSIFEIGRRLKHVKENDLAHGEFGKWLESIEMSNMQASRFMKVYEELEESNLTTSLNLGLNALYEIATLPPEEREKEHVTSKGETKTVDKMTVRELQEVKRKLREAEQAKQQAEREAEQARKSEQIAMEKLEAEQNKEPKIIYKVDEKRLEELNKKIGEQDTKLEELENEKLEIEERLKKAVEQTKDYKELKAELEEKKNELTALTQEQIRLKNRRIIYNHASKVTQDIGKTMNQIRLMIHERGDVAGDKEVYNTLNALIKMLREAIEEVESWLEIDVITDENLVVKDSGGEIIDLGEGEIEEVEII